MCDLCDSGCMYFACVSHLNSINTACRCVCVFDLRPGSRIGFVSDTDDSHKTCHAVVCTSSTLDRVCVSFAYIFYARPLVRIGFVVHPPV